MNIAQNIKARRLELEMPQKELADTIGYKSRSAIAKIESGDNDITLSKLVVFTHALDTAVEYLLLGLTSFENANQPEVSTDKTSDAPRSSPQEASRQEISKTRRTNLSTSWRTGDHLQSRNLSKAPSHRRYLHRLPRRLKGYCSRLCRPLQNLQATRCYPSWQK